MRGIRLNSLSVSHFRGINDSISFDFSSPLTVIYAPNGTGKTTMCEAAEWLLTGQVERLKVGSIFNASVLGPKFPSREGANTTAAADFYIDGAQQFVRREFTGSQTIAALGPDEDGTVTLRPNELMAFLAPVAASDEAPATTAINLRQRWLKGTRFLSSEALAALVDTDDETIERRAQVFADLLGIRHLLDAERQCEKYIAEQSRRLRNVLTLAESRAEEISNLKLALESDEAARSERSTSAHLEAVSAARLFGPDIDPEFDKQSSLDNQLASLTALHRRQKHGLSVRLEAAQRVESKWNIRNSMELAVNEGLTREALLVESLAQIELVGGEVGNQLSNLESRRDAIYWVSQELARVQSELSHLSTMLVAALLDSGFIEDSSLTLIELSELYFESQWPLRARRTRREALKKLESSISRFIYDSKRQEELKVAIDTARTDAPSPEALNHLHQEVFATSKDATSAARLLESVASPLERLRTAAKDLLSHEHSQDIGKCPLCSHDWNDAHALISAIEETLSAAPELVTAARSGMDAAENAARDAQNQLDAALRKQEYLETLEVELGTVQLALEAQVRERELLGMSKGATAEDFSVFNARLDVADALSSLMAARDAISPAVVGSDSPIPDSSMQVSNLLQYLESIFESRNRAVQLELAELAKSIDEANSDRDELRAKYSEARQSLNECRLGLEHKTAELGTLQAAWYEASPNIEWSSADLPLLMSELAKENARLTSIEGHIEAARAASATESRRTRLTDLQQTNEILANEASVMNGRLDAAKRARAVFYEAYTTISRQKVQDLSRVVNPLFARMHANRVVDRISLGGDADFLHWLADAGDQQLDPGKDFSQGQRQDLALALFLARARSLGGTFFLDEPIVHLDDLNRVGLLDILRATVMEGSNALNLVITTSSRSLARHLIEKFAGVGLVETPSGPKPPLRILELDGNGRRGIKLSTVYPMGRIST